MIQFIKKSLLFSLPLSLLGFIIIYSFYILDPFKILNEYEEYTNSIVSYNEDYIATERFLKNKNKFNSFIFGSSRAGTGFDIIDWNQELNSEDNAFSYTASNESLFGILGKLRLIQSENIELKNVLLVIDSDVTFKNLENSKGHLFIKHPRVSGDNENTFVFQFLRNYIFTGFFIPYLDYKIFNIERDYMNGYLNFNGLNEQEIYTPFNVSKKEARILSDKDAYYNSLSTNVFYKRPINQEFCSPSINSRGIEFLNEIKQIFNTNKTDYKIIISPLYDQKKLNKIDLNLIEDIFDKKNVFDFSGKNIMTDDKHNFYESSHYRQKIGKKILNIIY